MAPLKLFEGARPVGGRRAAVRDALAGVTLASMSIPQLLGYARIAGMPLITGLYTAFWCPSPSPCLVLRGTSSWPRIPVRRRSWRAR